MAGKASRFGHVKSAAESEALEAAEAALESGGIVQLNLKVSPALRTALRAKALRMGIPLTEALRPVLQAWAEADS